MREGAYNQRISRVLEIWKGRYNGEVVALKVLGGARDDPCVLSAKSVSTSQSQWRVARHFFNG